MSKCNVLGEKNVGAQWFFRQFLVSGCKTITYLKIGVLVRYRYIENKEESAALLLSCFV